MEVQPMPIRASYPPEELLDHSRKKMLEILPKIRAVALDLDGTLLDSKDHQISSFTVDYLHRLDARGIQLIIATGRPSPTVMQHVLKLNLPKPLPVICSNGARGLLCQAMPNGQVDVQEVFSSPVPLDITKRVIHFAEQLGHVVQFYDSNCVYANPSQEHHYALTNRYSENAGCEIHYVNDSFQLLLKFNKLPSKLLVLCPEEEVDATYSLFQEAFDKSEVSLIGGKSRGWFLEILSPGVCKGKGLERMCDVLDLSLDECVAFGDGSNDLEFLQMAGLGVAMKNAKDSVKRVANRVTRYTNNEDGVRRALQRMERKGMLQTTPLTPVASEIVITSLMNEILDEMPMKSQVMRGWLSQRISSVFAK